MGSGLSVEIGDAKANIQPWRVKRNIGGARHGESFGQCAWSGGKPTVFLNV